jgi:hypothetical protein
MVSFSLKKPQILLFLSGTSQQPFRIFQRDKALLIFSRNPSHTAIFSISIPEECQSCLLLKKEAARNLQIPARPQ